MDERLFEIGGQRPGRLREQDLPSLAFLILEVLQKQGSAGVRRRNGTEVVVLTGTGGRTMTVLGDEWALVIPHVRDGFFNPNVYPASSGFGYSETHVIEGVLDSRYRPLYLRILGVLQALFGSTSYPVSNL